MKMNLNFLKETTTTASIVFGLVIIALGVWSLYVWWWSFTEFIRGFVPVALVLFGLVALGAGLSSKRVQDNSDNEEE